METKHLTYYTEDGRPLPPGTKKIVDERGQTRFVVPAPPIMHRWLRGLPLDKLSMACHVLWRHCWEKYKSRPHECERDNQIIAKAHEDIRRARVWINDYKIYKKRPLRIYQPSESSFTKEGKLRPANELPYFVEALMSKKWASKPKVLQYLGERVTAIFKGIFKANYEGVFKAPALNAKDKQKTSDQRVTQYLTSDLLRKELNVDAVERLDTIAVHKNPLELLEEHEEPTPQEKFASADPKFFRKALEVALDKARLNPSAKKTLFHMLENNIDEFSKAYQACGLPTEKYEAAKKSWQRKRPLIKDILSSL